MLCVIMYCVLLCVMLFYCCYCLCVIMYCMLLCVVLFYCCHCLCVVVMCLYLLLYVVDDVLLVMCLLWRVRDWCACLMKGLSYQTYTKTFCRLMGGYILGNIYIFFWILTLLDNSHTKKFLNFIFRKIKFFSYSRNIGKKICRPIPAYHFGLTKNSTMLPRIF